MSKTVCESSILVSGFRIRILIFQEVIPTPVRSLQERPEDSNRAEDSKPGGETPAPKPSFGRMTQRQAWFQKLVFLTLKLKDFNLLSQSMTILNSSFQPSLQFNLRRAAKARINRMCQPHARRKDLEAPSYVVSEWQHNGNKNLMADILQRVNWDKDNELLTWLNCILDAKINVFEHCLRIECSLVDILVGCLLQRNPHHREKEEDVPTHHRWRMVFRRRS